MNEILTEDYMYIECITMLLYYWDLPKDRRPYYSSIYKECLNIATSRSTIKYPVLKELIAQEAIAFKTENGTAIQPDNGLVYILDTISLYVGDMPIDIMINIDVPDIIISRSTVNNILSTLN